MFSDGLPASSSKGWKTESQYARKFVGGRTCIDAPSAGYRVKVVRRRCDAAIQACILLQSGFNPRIATINTTKAVEHEDGGQQQ